MILAWFVVPLFEKLVFGDEKFLSEIELFSCTVDFVVLGEILNEFLIDLVVWGVPVEY